MRKSPEELAAIRERRKKELAELTRKFPSASLSPYGSFPYLFFESGNVDLLTLRHESRRQSEDVHFYLSDDLTATASFISALVVRYNSLVSRLNEEAAKCPPLAKGEQVAI